MLAGSQQIVPGTPCKLVHFPALVQVDLLIVGVAPAVLPLLVEVEGLGDSAVPALPLLLVEVEVLGDAVAPGLPLLPQSQGSPLLVVVVVLLLCQAVERGVRGHQL